MNPSHASSNAPHAACPDAAGHFGPFGGRYVAETLMPAVLELEDAYRRIAPDPTLPHRARAPAAGLSPAVRRRSVSRRTPDRAGSAEPRSTSSARTSPTPAPTRSTTPSARRCSPAGWASASSSPKPAPGQHGVATATTAALFGMECRIFMGVEDIRRQAPNVQRMRLLGAEVVPVASRHRHPQGRHERGDALLGRGRGATPFTSSARSPARTPTP